jgi:hypothetical protein
MNKTIEQVIAERGYIVTKPKGTSMFPLIRSNNDDIYVVKPQLPLNVFDIPVYRRKSGEYVMHRILDKDDKGYICCGDNQWVLEYGINDSQIVGVLKEWYHKNKKHTVEDKGYLRYVRFWCKSLKLRHFILYFCHIHMNFKAKLKAKRR